MTSCEIGVAQNNPPNGIDKARSGKMKPINALSPDQAEHLLKCASPEIIPSSLSDCSPGCALMKS